MSISAMLYKVCMQVRLMAHLVTVLQRLSFFSFFLMHMGYSLIYSLIDKQFFTDSVLRLFDYLGVSRVLKTWGNTREQRRNGNEN